MVTEKQKRVLVTGGGTYLGMSIAIALLAEGADVTLLVREGNEKKLGMLAQRVRWYHADMWDSASLRGRARGHGVLIHTVGSMKADARQGLTYHRLNVISARHAVNMCISDGVPYMVFMSAATAPWISRDYILSKREAEAYLRRTGIKHATIRAPLTYTRGQSRPVFYRLMSLLGIVPPLSWLGMRNVAPLPIDIVARGVARCALRPPSDNSWVVRGGDLRRMNSPDERRGKVRPVEEAELKALRRNNAFALLDEDMPFGWSPVSED